MDNDFGGAKATAAVTGPSHVFFRNSWYADRILLDLVLVIRGSNEDQYVCRCSEVDLDLDSLWEAAFSVELDA